MTSHWKQWLSQLHKYPDCSPFFDKKRLDWKQMNYKPKKNQTKQKRPIACGLRKQEKQKNRQRIQLRRWSSIHMLPEGKKQLTKWDRRQVPNTRSRTVKKSTQQPKHINVGWEANLMFSSRFSGWKSQLFSVLTNSTCKVFLWRELWLKVFLKKLNNVFEGAF